MVTAHSTVQRSPQKVVCAVVVCLIAVWQLSFHYHADRIDNAFWNPGSTGLSGDLRVFFNFYWKFGYFPLGIELASFGTDQMQVDERTLVTEYGRELVMGYNFAANSTRDGDWGKLFLYVPHALLRGTGMNCSVLPANMMFWIAALVGLFVAFWSIGYPALGLLMVALLGSQPFQLAELYRRENVFSYPITVAIILLAMHLRLLKSSARAGSFIWLLPAASGVILACAREIRPEPAMLILPLPLIYLSIRSLRWFSRFGLVAVLVVAFLGTTQLFGAYFDYTFQETARFVREAGGHPYPGPRYHHHVAIHNIFLGLADFDRTHGYYWDDRCAYRYATPILKYDYGIDYHLDGWYFRETYDMAGVYQIKPEDLPEYREILTRKVIGDVRADPGWYFGILARRVWRTLTETTPVQFAFGGNYIRVGFDGILALLTLIGLLICRQYFFAKLIVFTLPLALPAIMVYSAQGMTYYGIYHIIAFSILAYVVGEPIVRYARARLAARGKSVAEAQATVSSA